jgi:hypothetical protein
VAAPYTRRRLIQTVRDCFVAGLQCETRGMRGALLTSLGIDGVLRFSQHRWAALRVLRISRPAIGAVHWDRHVNAKSSAGIHFLSLQLR